MTVDKDSGRLPGPAEFTVAAEQAVSAWPASVMRDGPAAVAVALAVVSEVLSGLATVP